MLCKQEALGRYNGTPKEAHASLFLLPYKVRFKWEEIDSWGGGADKKIIICQDITLMPILT